MPTNCHRLTRSSVACLVSLATIAAGCQGGANEVTPVETAVSDSATALFDTTVVHEVSLDVEEAEYDAAVTAYVEDGEKIWITATVTIDGSTYEDVGLRLKGNSTLRALSGEGMATGGAMSADEPEGLPWLIRLDRNVEGQTHQGYEDLVIRANAAATALNEAVALDLLALAGLPSEQGISVAFSVNGSDPVLRLAIEHPDDDAWYERVFDSDGAIYKAESTGDWTYRGDDPAAYEDVFDQEGGSDLTDLSPLIELLAFVDEADETTFAAGLADRLDVEGFATYLAMMELLSNSDDINGRGNNAYVWWDADTGLLTIVPWDLNLSLGVTSTGGVGGRPGPAGGGPGGGSAVTNPLVDRFLAVPAFAQLQADALAELDATLFASGTADEVLDARIALIESSGLIDPAVLEAEADVVRRALG